MAKQWVSGNWRIKNSGNGVGERKVFPWLTNACAGSNKCSSKGVRT